MCSSHATVRGLLHEAPDDERVIVVDNEASPEHLSRATPEAVDLMLVVAEPYFKSLETARRYSVMGRELGIPQVSILANKVRDDRDADAIEGFCEQHSLDLIAQIPFDPELAEAERAGVAPVDHDPSLPSVRTIAGLVDRLLGSRATVTGA